MEPTKKYTDKSNARRAAERMLEKGEAPALGYFIRPVESGNGYEIVWRTSGAPEPVAAGKTTLGQAIVETLVDTTIADRFADGTLTVHEVVCAPSDPIRLEEEPAAPAPTKAPKTKAAAKAKAQAPKGRKAAGAPDGSVPVKPVITSLSNLSYQGRIDDLAEMAEAGDWKGVQGYEVNGKNTYARIVARYRDALLAAHKAARFKGRNELPDNFAAGDER